MKLSEGVARETLVLIGGAILAAYLIGQVPGLRAWIARQWKAPGGCSCGD